AVEPCPLPRRAVPAPHECRALVDADGPHVLCAASPYPDEDAACRVERGCPRGPIPSHHDLSVTHGPRIARSTRPHAEEVDRGSARHEGPDDTVVVQDRARIADGPHIVRCTARDRREAAG